MLRERQDFLDPRPILTLDFDIFIFIVEDLRALPIGELAKIFERIKERARTVHIVHEDKLPEETWFYLPARIFSIPEILL